MANIMISRGLNLRIIVLLIATDLIEALIMFSFKMVSMVISTEMPIGLLVRALVQSPFLWLGVLSMLSSFIIWTTILSNIDLSVAFPLGSLTFVLVPVFSIIFLHEQISLLRWVGIGCISAGIVLLAYNKKPEKEPA